MQKVGVVEVRNPMRRFQNGRKRNHVDSPAIIVELKYGNPVDTAISQIEQKNYPAKVAEYAGNLLLVGISYDKKQKKYDKAISKILSEKQMEGYQEIKTQFASQRRVRDFLFGSPQDFNKDGKDK